MRMTVMNRAMHLRTSSHGHLWVAMAVTAILVAGLAALLAAPLVGGDSSSPSLGPAKVVEGHGLRIELPAGWDGRVRSEGPGTAIELEAASVPLEQGRSRLELQRTMEEHDVYLRVLDTLLEPEEVAGDESWSVDSMVRFAAADISPVFEGVELPAYSARFVVVGDRPLMVYLGFGRIPSAADLDAANSVLATLTVRQRT
jgi:hypothetical protein